MKKHHFAAIAALTFAFASQSQAQDAMTNAQLTDLLQDGITLSLGGKGQGYSGELTLAKDGTGQGSAKTDDGNQINIAGTWSVKDDTFCRVWVDLNEGKEICETWIVTGENSVDVFNGDKKIGVNSW